MNFNELIQHLDTHPDDTRRLAALLSTSQPKPQEEEWVTLREAGRRLGMGVTWVRERKGLLPPSAVRTRPRGEHGTISYINFPVAKPHLIHFLTVENKSTRTAF